MSLRVSALQGVKGVVPRNDDHVMSLVARAKEIACCYSELLA